MAQFRLQSDYQPCGDQPQAIKELVEGLERGDRHQVGETPATLFSYLPDDALMFIDESHVSVSQVGGMYRGDRSRK